MASDGTVRSIYLHHDGYPEHALATLKRSYSTVESLGALIDLDVLADTLDETIAFGRDRADIATNTDAEDHLLAEWPDSGQEYEYLYDATFLVWTMRSVYGENVWRNA
jgi:hypothetical protein